MRTISVPLSFFMAVGLHAQMDPLITSWVINPGGELGYGGMESNVLAVSYSDSNVYVNCNSVPGYTIGPWPGDPWQPNEMGFMFKFTRFPMANTGVPIQTPYGHIGTWINGVSIYNPKDAHSWNETGIWFQNAFFFENSTFDDCLGHPNNLNEYHTHVNPTCLYDETDSTVHSPIIGWAFDGFPIYGAYGYANPDGTGGITRMRSSWRLRAITDRSTLPNGTMLPPSDQGPPLDLYGLGAYIQDHEFVMGSGTLDRLNGRSGVTPEFPDGTYAYFVTLDADLYPAYPYVLGPAYYGTVQPGNTGPGSGYNEILEEVTVYTPSTDVEDGITSPLSIHPNPASDAITISGADADMQATLFDASGRSVRRLGLGWGNGTMALGDLPVGTYTLQLAATDRTSVHRITIAR